MVELALELGDPLFRRMVRISEGTAPDTKNRPFSVTADVVVPEAGAEGMLATQGGNFGGWGLFVDGGKPQFVYAFSNQPQHKYRIASAQALPPGKHAIRFDFEYDGGGRGKGAMGVLSVNGAKVAEARIPVTIANRYSLDETFDVGEDTGTALVDDYSSRMPFHFTGALEKLTIDLKDPKP